LLYKGIKSKIIQIKKKFIYLYQEVIFKMKISSFKLVETICIYLGTYYTVLWLSCKVVTNILVLYKPLNSVNHPIICL